MSEPDIILRYSPGPTNGFGCALVVAGAMTVFFAVNAVVAFSMAPVPALWMLAFMAMLWGMLWLGRPRPLTLARRNGTLYLTVAGGREKALSARRVTSGQFRWTGYDFGSCTVRLKIFPWIAFVHFHDPGSADAFARKVNAKLGIKAKKA